MKRITSILVFLVFLGCLAFAQDVQITGTITSAEDGSSLPGVSIVIKGTNTGTTTDADGMYKITVPADATLIFNFVGMQSQEIEVGDQTVINFAMEPEAQALSEVIVTAIGISRSEKALGYSVSTVSSDKTVQKSEPDLLKSLQGKVPGVDIRNAGGSPGGASRITIRGVSSFLGDNQPLFVVDGIPYSNDQLNTTSQNVGGGAYGSGISTLDPNDIETVSVLKGAPAASLYGSRAKNGVILISTKSGNANASKKGFEVSLTSSVNFETIANLPEYQNTYGNGVDFLYQNANGSWGSRFDSMDSIPTWPQYLAAFPDMGDSIAWEAQPDNVKNLFQTGVVYENSLNVSGGNGNTAYNFTLSHLKNDSYIPNATFKRYSISAGGSTKLVNKLVASGSFSYTNSEQIGGLFGNNQASDDNAASSFARTLWLGRAWDTDLPYEDPATGGPVNWNGNSQYDHPLWSWKHNKVTTDMDRVIANTKLEYEIADWVSLSYQIGLNNLYQKRKQIIDKYSRGYGGLGAIIEDNYKDQEIESNLLLTIKHQITSDLDFSFVIGNNVNQRKSERSAYRGLEIINPGIYNVNNTKGVIPFPVDYDGLYKRRLVGAFGDLTLNYKTFLFLNLTGRNDWSSTLPKDNNQYFYPAISSSFIFTDALNIENNIFTFGKLRIGWGQVGMDADAYSILNAYENKATAVPNYKYNSFPFLGQPTMTTPDEGNSPNLEPEKKTEFEVGTDLRFFNNRISIDLTYYNNTSTNNIFPVSVPATSGFTSQWTNIGKLNNKGVELGLNLIPVSTGSGLVWEIYTNFTKNKSEVLDIFDGDPDSGVVERTILYSLFGDPSIIVEVGQPYGVFYGNVNYRDDEGNLLIDPSTGLLIRSTEQKVYGDPNPDFKLSITNTLKFKGLSLAILFDYTKGGDIVSNAITSLLGRGVTKDTEDRERTVIVPGFYGDPDTGEPLLDNNGNKIPNTVQVGENDLYFGESFAINSAGEWNVYDGTVYRLREISLGYDLPKKWLSKSPFGSASLSFTGRNLWFFAPNMPKYTNFDPEVNGYGSSNIQGIEYSVAPTVKRYGVNLKVTF